MSQSHFRSQGPNGGHLGSDDVTSLALKRGPPSLIGLRDAIGTKGAPILLTFIQNNKTEPIV